MFLNNVSLGMYAQLVHEREEHRRRRETLARARAVVIALRHLSTRGLSVDGEPISCRVLLVSNNEYKLDLLSVGERERLDEGLLTCYAGSGILRASWTERSGERFTVDARAGSLRAAIDGEPARLETPLEFEIEPVRATRARPASVRSPSTLFVEGELCRRRKLVAARTT